jgi:hypothetical protein
VDTSALESLVADGRAWVKLGKVFSPDGGSHWQVKDGKLLLEVETLPDGLDLTCRLATWGSGGGFGGWAIPRVGSIVAVLVPDGMVEFSPIVIGVLDCNATPAGVGEGMTLIADDRTVVIRAPGIKLGDSDATESAVHGDAQKSALDTFTNALNVYASAIQSIADPSHAATTALATAVTAFQTALASSLSPTVKVK